MPPIQPFASPLSAATSPLPDLLLVESEESSRHYAAALREKFRVTHTPTHEAALRAMQGLAPAFVMLELGSSSPDGAAVCSAAKQLAVPSTVLVTTTDATRVPDVLAAGCDAVLLKPFAPNLLFARLGRLMRERSIELRYRSQRQRAKSQHLQERSDLLLAGTNQHWPESHCPYCSHQGVTSFEYTSYRRAWYACLACRRVWLAKRQE